MTINQVVAGAAAITNVNGTFTASVPGAGQTFSVLNASGYPATGRFVVQLNRAQPDEEKVLISSRSGTTFTVETRGYDGTTAQSHTNPTCNLILPATVVNALIDHADDNEVDPHAAKLLNNARHDVTARHALGTSVPTSASLPPAITPDHAGTAGTANSVARSDHAHPISAAAAVSVNGTNGEGAATTFARSDHTHDYGTGTVDSDALGTGAISSLAKFTSTVLDRLIPVGVALPFGGTAAPTGWLLCDGAAVSRSTYATLFAVVGTTFGAGNGSTTFNLPDMRGRFPLGKAASGTGSTLGGTGGTIDHVHDLDTPTSHARISWLHDAAANDPQMKQRTGVPSWGSTMAGNANLGAAAGTSFTDGPELAGLTDSDNPPFQAFNYIIRTGE